jgi:hypothetical protein
MQPPKTITIKKPNTASMAADVPNLPTQQLYEKNQIVTELSMKEVTDGEAFFPRGLHLEDLDAAFVDWVKKLGFESNGVQTPVFLFTLQRFSEFMQTWGDTDETKHPKLPLITITKESPGKRGTYLGGVSTTLPSGETFPLYRIPKVVNGKTIFEYIEIPQPTFVDLQYKVNFFSNHLRESNKFNEMLLQEFKKPQNSVNIFGHNMELALDDIVENNKKEIEERRYYRLNFVINMKAFIYDEKDMKVKRSVNNIKMTTSPLSPSISPVCNIEAILNSEDCNQALVFNLNKKSPSTIEYPMTTNFAVQFDNQSTSNTNVNYFVNNSPSTLPFSLNVGDVLKLVYTKTITKPVQIKLYGIAS